MKLLDQARHVARVKHFSYRTEQCYVYWIERYIRFHGIRHPNTMGTPEVEQFLTHLAVAGHVAASTQNQALGALLFVCRDVMARGVKEIANWPLQIGHCKLKCVTAKLAIAN